MTPDKIKEIAERCADEFISRLAPQRDSIVTSIESAINEATVEAKNANEVYKRLLSEELDKTLQLQSTVHQLREALECAEYALTHLKSDQAFAVNACRQALSNTTPKPNDDSELLDWLAFHWKIGIDILSTCTRSNFRDAIRAAMKTNSTDKPISLSGIQPKGDNERF